MGLKLTPNPTFNGKVEFTLPDGKIAKIGLTFKHMGRREFRDWLEGFTGGDDVEARDDEEAMADIVLGWTGVDADFSKENLETLTDSYPSFSRAAVTAYITALTEGGRKN